MLWAYDILYINIHSFKNSIAYHTISITNNEFVTVLKKQPILMIVVCHKSVYSFTRFMKFIMHGKKIEKLNHLQCLSQLASFHVINT